MLENLVGYFCGNRQEIAVFQKRDQLRVKPNLSRREQYRLADLEEDARGISSRLFLRRLGAGGVVLAGGGIVGALRYFSSERSQVPDLGLNIDEAGFWKAVNAGPGLAIITQTEDRNKMDHLRPHGNLWVAEASRSFRVAINQPMADLIFSQAGLTNPSLPTRISFVEEWLEPGQTAGYTAISSSGSDQIVVVSLKATSYEAFKDLEKKRLSIADYFDGAVSYFVSSNMARLAADAGIRTKKLLKSGDSLIPDHLLDATRPQLEAFQQKYARLYSQAVTRRVGEGALILAVNLEGVNLQNYRLQILQEARARGIDK